LSKNILMCASLLVATIFLAGCNRSPETANANANDNANAAPAVATTTTRPGPDNSEITTATDANGVKTETRTFRDNTHVSRVVVTTRNGARTARVYSRSGEAKDLESGESQNALEKTGDAIASTAGFVAGKTVEGAKKGVEVGKDVGVKTAEGTKKVAEKTADVAKTVGTKTAGAAKTVGEKTAEGAETVGTKTAGAAKTVAKKTATGAKKTGRAIKRVVSP